MPKIEVRPWLPRLRFNKRIWGFKRGRGSAGSSVELAGVVEDCLRPYLVTGDIVMYSKLLEPMDRDVVMVSMRYRCTPRLGSPPAVAIRLAIKQLRIVDGQAWLCSTDGSVAADADQVLGVVFGWCRTGLGRFAWRKPMRKMDFSIG